MTMTQTQEWADKVGQITAKAWSDADFKRRLLSDPAGVLKDFGLTFPPNVEVKVIEDTDTLYHFSLPPKPTAEELSEEHLTAVGSDVLIVPTCRRCVKTGL
jgi:hypothetical protein